MAIVLTVDGNDRTDYVDKDSFDFKNVANDEVDSINFTLKVNQTNLASIKPAYNDEVSLTSGGTKVFGGRIQRIRETEIGFNVYLLECEAKDFSHDFTRKRVADVFEDVSDLYVVNEIVNDYINLDKKIIDPMESGWSAGSADTDDFVEGTQSLKITNQTVTKALTLDLTQFDNGTASVDADFIDLWYYVDDKDNLTSIEIRLGDTGLTNYKNYVVNSGFATGWNYFHIAKSAFSETGSIAWSAITEASLNATGTADVSFDDIRLISAANGFDKTNVSVSNLVDVAYLPFNYLPAFQAMQDLSRLTAKYWYVDENKSVHYFKAGFETAPFTITDTNGNMIIRSLVTLEDGTEIKNIAFVRGSEFLAGTRYEQIEFGDGDKRSWEIDYRGTSLRVFTDVGAGFVERTVGIANIDPDDGTYDWLWNNTEKFVVQDSVGVTLTAAQRIKVDLFPYLPVITRVTDLSSVDSFGDNETLLIDKNIKTKEGAQELGNAEINAFKEQLVDGGFSTLTDGLKAGQQINITSAKRSLNRNFIIWSVTARMHTEDEFIYDVELISTNKLTLANTLIQLLLEKTKEVVVDDNETVDVLEPHDENIIIQEAHTESLNTAIAAKWGPHAEQGTYTTFYKYS